MEHTWRWFGPADPITLAEIRQTGATGVVTALHDIPVGDLWPVEAIVRHKAVIEEAGLTWSVVESVPVHDDIKRGEPGADRWIESWAQTLRNLAACGIDTVCYNFMPVLDWARTDLRHRLADGTWALRFDHDDFAVFDLFILSRPAASADYTDAQLHRARQRFDAMTKQQRQQLSDAVAMPLPGATATRSLEDLRKDLAAFAGISAATLRENLRTFLRQVVPVAAEAGVRLAIHPDDPPRPLLGLPRVVSTAADARWILESVDEPANGLTLCVGSYGVRGDNDILAMIREFGPRIHFTHLRSTRREADDLSFHEAVHIDGDIDMVAIVRELCREERRRETHGGARLPMRPDHGHQMLYDQSNERRTYPGYSLLGRMKGLAELRGVEKAVRSLEGDACVSC
jgi:mannonate dehydratase